MVNHTNKGLLGFEIMKISINVISLQAIKAANRVAM